MRCLYLLLIINFFLVSCEEVIDLELNSSSPLYVIDAELSNLNAQQNIYISESVSFNEPYSKKPIEDATVGVMNEKGEYFPFEHVSNGIYRSYFIPQSNIRYDLNVKINNKSFISSSYMNDYIDVDSLGFVEDVVFKDTVYSVTLKFMDPINESNYYKYNISVNGRPNEFNRVFNDKYNDGLFVTHQLSGNRDDFQLGDSIVVTRYIIDKEVYKYWNDVTSINPGSAAPANPLSNISNGALGYFSVSSAKKYNFILKMD